MRWMCMSRRDSLLHPDQDLRRVADICLRGLVADFDGNPLSLLAEGHTKTIIANALLCEGYSITEGKPGEKGYGYRLSLAGEKLNAVVEKIPPRANKTPDLRVLVDQYSRPLLIEIKTRFSYGAQGSGYADPILDDINVVRRGLADLFLLASSSIVYTALWSKHSHIFPAVQPIFSSEDVEWGITPDSVLVSKIETKTSAKHGHSAVFLALARPSVSKDTAATQDP